MIFGNLIGFCFVLYFKYMQIVNLRQVSGYLFLCFYSLGYKIIGAVSVQLIERAVVQKKGNLRRIERLTNADKCLFVYITFVFIG